MTWLNDLTRAFGSKKKGWMSQLYNWQIPGKVSEAYPTGKASLKELYSPEGYFKGGKFVGQAASTRIGSSFEGLKQGLFPVKAEGGKDSIFDKFGNLIDSGSEFVEAGTERVTNPLGDFDLQEWLNNQMDKAKEGAGGIIPEGGLVQIPKVDLTPMKEGMDNFATGLAMGLGSLGQGVGGGIGDAVPSMQLVDDEGEPNILLIGGLAFLAYKVLSGGKK